MKRNKKISLILGTLVSTWIVAHSPISAAAIFDTQVPNLFYEFPYLTVENVVLGRTCSSLPAGNDSLPCNPAYLAQSKKEVFRATIFIDDHFQKAFDYAKDLNAGDAIRAVNRLLNDQQASGARMAGSLWYQDEWWALSFTPARIAYVSETRNPAYPELAVHAVNESELALKMGAHYLTSPNLNFGLQVRYLDRDYIRQDIALLDAFSDPSRFRVKNIKGLNFEPSVIYTLENDVWKPSVSVMITDLQVVLSGDKEDGTFPVPEFGFTSRPSFADGRLVTSTHFTLRRHTEFWKRLRWGAVYHSAGFGDFALSFAKGEAGASVSYAIDSVTLGLAYKTEEVTATRWQSNTISSLMGEVGLRF